MLTISSPLLYQPDEIRRTLTDKNSDSSAVVSSLKQKIHLMERNVKDKENELRYAEMSELIYVKDFI